MKKVIKIVLILTVCAIMLFSFACAKESQKPNNYDNDDNWTDFYSR